MLFRSGWLVPAALTPEGIARIVAAFAAAAARANAAGVDAVEIHGAHGYLVHSFLSPVVNTRRDAYGGDLAGRMRFALEIARVVRAAWPAGKPLFFRASTFDGIDGGWSLDDTIALAKALKAIGVDVVDCSAGGFLSSRLEFARGYLVPNAARVRSEAGIATGADMKRGPQNSIKCGGLIDCTCAQRWPVLLPKSRNQRPPGHNSIFIGVSPPGPLIISAT